LYVGVTNRTVYECFVGHDVDVNFHNMKLQKNNH